MAKRLRIEVVYALPGRLDAVRLELDEGAAVGDALEASGLLERHPEIDPQRQPLGIHGRRVTPGRVLADGDRVEVYRGFVGDVKEARRARARRRARPER